MYQIDYLKSELEPIMVSKPLLGVIIRTLQKNPTMRNLESLSMADLAPKIKELGLQAIYEEQPVSFQLTVLEVFPLIGMVTVKLSLQIWGKAEKQKLLHREIIERYHLTGVALANDGIIFKVFLKGQSWPVEIFNKEKNGHDGRAFCTKGCLEKEEKNKK